VPDAPRPLKLRLNIRSGEIQGKRGDLMFMPSQPRASQHSLEALPVGAQPVTQPIQLGAGNTDFA